MKIRAIFLLCIIFMASGNLNLSAQNVTITVLQPLNFGTFYPGLFGGTVSVSSSGSRTSTGTVILINDSQNTPENLSVRLTASKGNTTFYQITFSSPIILTGSNGGSLTLTMGTPNPDPASSTISVKQNNPATINFGGTLQVGGITANPNGTYTGQFTVNFIYY
jgi:hypothetical protein